MRAGIGRRAVTVAISLLGLFVPLLGGSSEAADLSCGAVLGPGGNFRLTSPIGPCDGPAPALTLIGPVTLDLAGVAVTCTPSSGTVGIELRGRGAHLNNSKPWEGGVQFCRNAVRVDGWRHTITDVLALNSAEDAFLVSGAGHLVARNQALDAGADPVAERCGFLVLADRVLLLENFAGDAPTGYCVAGDLDRLVQNDADGNGVGFHVRASGTAAVLRGNTATDNAAAGFVVDGDHATIRRNLSNDNGADGFIIAATRNQVTRNDASGNGASGIRVNGDANTILGNRADHVGAAGAGSGIVVTGDGNRVRGNVADDAVDNGIEVSGHSNVIVGNEALRSGGTDLVDTSPLCDTNQWRNNVFGTRAQSCSQ